MRVSICGPNLRDQSKGQFHVHAANCADLKHYGWNGNKYGGETPWTVEAETREDAVEALYGPDEFEYDPATEIGPYMDDMYFAPCCANLPNRKGE